AAGGAPLAALRLSQSGEQACPDWLSKLIEPLAKGQMPDIVTLAENLEKRPPADLIDTLQRLYADLMLTGVGAPVRYFPSLAGPVGQTSARADAVRLAEGARWLTQQRRLASHPLSPKLFAHATLQRVAPSCLA